HTFQSKKNYIYFKTIARTFLKGLASVKAKEKLRKEAKAKDNFFLKTLINAGVDAVVDATENADLRCWRTMPRYCYIGEIPVPSDTCQISLQFFNAENQLLMSREFADFVVNKKLNLLELVYLN
ncbi:MAG: hypothetical protein WAN36_09705, partial [Calditrichia bacterium]